MPNIPLSDHPPVSDKDMHTVSETNWNFMIHELVDENRTGAYDYASHPERPPKIAKNCLMI